MRDVVCVCVCVCVCVSECGCVCVCVCVCVCGAGACGVLFLYYTSMYSCMWQPLCPDKFLRDQIT